MSTGNYEMGSAGLGGSVPSRSRSNNYRFKHRTWLYAQTGPLNVAGHRTGRLQPTIRVNAGVTFLGSPNVGGHWVRVWRLGPGTYVWGPDEGEVWVRTAEVESISGGGPVLGFGEADAAAAPDTTDSDFLSMLGKLAIPVLVIGAGVYIGSKLAKVANRKANARRRNRRRNAPFRVSYLRDFDALGAARTDYGQLPSAGYASVRDLGKAGGKLKGGGRWRTKLIAKRGGL